MEGRDENVYRLEAYHYDLPDTLIAQTPSARRESSRLLVLRRAGGGMEHRCFADLPMLLRSGDVLVVNDTRVVPARLCGTKESGGRIELLVLDPYKEPEAGRREGYECLLKASKRSKTGTVIDLKDGLRAQVLEPLGEGKARIRFLHQEPLLQLLERVGQVPLPPYIQRSNGASATEDVWAYQTVYARNPGAVAAPTAGLHFSDALLDELQQRGIEVVTVTLHVGYGTFTPVRVSDVREHRMHPEYAEITGVAADHIEHARRQGRRIVAVGTTVVRILEWVCLEFGTIVPFAGSCNHYIYPGYDFRVVGAMVTNFHLPMSTLLLLVSAFAGRETILHAYREAVKKEYRFYSYGDAMMIA